MLAYLVDSTVLFGFCMVFATIGFMVIFLGSEAGRSTITARQEWGLLLSFMATVPVWYTFNTVLMSARSHTVGQYVLGLRVVAEDGHRPRPGRVAVYWLALHPLLFHPLLVLPWVLFAFMGVAIAGSGTLFLMATVVVFLCLVAPLANLAFMLANRKRQGIHDKLAGLKVVRI